MKTINFFSLLLIISAIMFLPAKLSSQVTIGGTSDPQSFSILELISSGERGFRLPQLTYEQRRALTPALEASPRDSQGVSAAMGLRIFNTCNQCVETWNGDDWISFCFSDGDDPLITDPGVVIAGIRWATRNVDRPGTFAANPEDLGMFYQWNRNIGWSSTDPMINSNGGTTWDNSIPTGTTWESANCPCPPGWRVPTDTELGLLNAAGHTWHLNWNDTGVNGRLYGTAPYQIFLPVAGFRDNTNGDLDLLGDSRYWSSMQEGSSNARLLWVGSGFSNPSNLPRANSFFVRCVAEN